MTLQEIKALYNEGKLSGDAQVWWTMETGDMRIATDKEMEEEHDWSYAGTVREMVEANA